MVEPGHADEHGTPCRHHPPVAIDTLLQYALLGSRMTGFHHDIASKLQGLMMALDEITELVESVPGERSDLRRAADTATEALKELNALLTTNRALAKPPSCARTSLRELAARAGERVGVRLGDGIPDATVEVSVPAALHGLALAFDVAAGRGRSRTLDVRATISETRATLALPKAETANATVSESLAIASWVLAREGGSLRCHGAGELVIALPLVR